MKSKKNGRRKHRRPSLALVSKALNAAVKDAVELHRQAGLPLAVWQDGKVVLVPADDVAVGRRSAKSRRRKSRG